MGAAMFCAQVMPRQSGEHVESVRDEVRANLVPGVVLMPSGVFAVARAQEAGCQLIKSA